MLLDLANCFKLSSIKDDVNILKSVRHVSLGVSAKLFSREPLEPINLGVLNFDVAKKGQLL